MSIESMLSAMSAQWQRERSETQMTLGELIAALSMLPADAEVDGLEAAHSYRGYYSDLAFEPTGGKVKAAKLLAECRGAMGKEFTGYKGGEYVMGAATPVWVSHYGYCGLKLMGLSPDGTIVTAEDD